MPEMLCPSRRRTRGATCAVVVLVSVLAGGLSGCGSMDRGDQMMSDATPMPARVASEPARPRESTYRPRPGLPMLPPVPQEANAQAPVVTGSINTMALLPEAGSE